MDTSKEVASPGGPTTTCTVVLAPPDAITVMTALPVDMAETLPTAFTVATLSFEDEKLSTSPVASGA